MGTIYGYARCSTNEKRQDIDRQKRELMAMGVTKETDIYFEYESGTKDDRVELQKLLERVEAGDTICTTEVSRLTRSTMKLCEILQIVKDKHLMLDIGGSFKVDCRNSEIDPMTKGMVMMWAVFSELERDIISQRVKSGMANAREKGKIIGRPELTRENLPDRFWKYYAMYKNNGLTITEFANLMQVTRATIYKYISIAEE